MNKFCLSVYTLLLGVLLIACERDPEVIKDMSDQSFQLLDQDSTQVTFPEDFKGNLTVVGFIYTNCPDICPAITANMSNINKMLENKENVRFVGITFDPQRDTPAVLQKYMDQFRLDEQKFTFLTGDSATVDSLLETMGHYG